MRAGDDKGRIYRIYPENKQPRPVARLDKLDTAGLVAALDSPNGPQRDLVQQMLVWRGDQAAVEPLKKLAASATRPQTRLQAICTLDGLGAASIEAVRAALADSHAAVRRHAVRLAESKLEFHPELAADIAKLANDSDPQVRIQVAYSLGDAPPAVSAEALSSLLLAGTSDPYLTAAALSSLNKKNIYLVLD